MLFTDNKELIEVETLRQVAYCLPELVRQLEIANRLKLVEIERSFVTYHNEMESTYKKFEEIKQMVDERAGSQETKEN